MSATEKLAISLPKDLIEKLRRAREEGRIESVSGHIADLLRREDDWLDARATLDRIYESCPEPEAEHYAWARRALGAGPGGPGGRPPGTPGDAGPGGRPAGTPAEPAA